MIKRERTIDEISIDSFQFPVIYVSTGNSPVNQLKMD